jgi:hypothetical protein
MKTPKEILKENGIEITDFISSSSYDALKQLIENLLIERDVLINALDGLLNKNEGCGCPMCDNGKLRDPNKDHWDDCVWNNAVKTIENRGTITTKRIDINRIINVYDNCYEALKTLVDDRWRADNVNKIQSLDNKIKQVKTEIQNS